MLYLLHLTAGNAISQVGWCLIFVQIVMVIFLVSGFWHGANWTFIAWGGLHAALFLPLLFGNWNRTNLVIRPYGWLDAFKIATTFFLVCVAWVFFRADSLSVAVTYLDELSNLNSLSMHFFVKNNAYTLQFLISVVAIFILGTFELFWILQKRETPNLNRYCTVLLILAICFMGSFKNQMDFIYFQF